MATILREDPDPELWEGCKPESKDPFDYIWGYEPETIEKYMWHAERFYQLFRLKYTADKLTPYMIKFIDQVPVLIKTLPFPLSRLEAEAGEHIK